MRYGGGGRRRHRKRTSRDLRDLLTTKVFRSTTGTPGNAGLWTDRRQLASSLSHPHRSIDLSLHADSARRSLTSRPSTSSAEADRGLAQQLRPCGARGGGSRPMALVRTLQLLGHGDEADAAPAPSGIAVPAGVSRLATGKTGAVRRSSGSRMTLGRTGRQLIDDQDLRRPRPARGGAAASTCRRSRSPGARIDGAVRPNRADQLGPVRCARLPRGEDRAESGTREGWFGRPRVRRLLPMDVASR
jgi:hypothetical protein